MPGWRGLPAPRGFTLTQLLIVVVIVGILVTLAIPRLANTKQKGFDAAAKSDLRNAMTAEEAYFATHQTYAAPAELAFTTSFGVQIGGGGSASGYFLTAKHAASSNTWHVDGGPGSSRVDPSKSGSSPLSPGR